MLYGKDWKKMQPLIKSRSLVQIRTHAQKVFKKIGLKKAFMLGANKRAKLEVISSSGPDGSTVTQRVSLIICVLSQQLPFTFYLSMAG